MTKIKTYIAQSAAVTSDEKMGSLPQKLIGLLGRSILSTPTTPREAARMAVVGIKYIKDEIPDLADSTTLPMRLLQSLLTQLRETLRLAQDDPDTLQRSLLGQTKMPEWATVDSQPQSATRGKKDHIDDQ
jgi:hypothetical protein